MQKKNIHFIMPSMVGGGAERVVSVLTAYFNNTGREVTIHLFKQDVIEYEIPKGVKIDKSTLRGKKGFSEKWKRLTDIRR